MGKKTSEVGVYLAILVRPPTVSRCVGLVWISLRILRLHFNLGRLMALQSDQCLWILWYGMRKYFLGRISYPLRRTEEVQRLPIQLRLLLPHLLLFLFRKVVKNLD